MSIYRRVSEYRIPQEWNRAEIQIRMVNPDNKAEEPALDETCIIHFQELFNDVLAHPQDSSNHVIGGDKTEAANAFVRTLFGAAR